VDNNLMQHAKRILLVLAAVLALVAGLWLGEWFTRPRVVEPLSIGGFHFPQPREVADLQLTRQDGRPLTRDDWRNRWSFLYFGYTYCPDVCPTTLIELNRLHKLLVQQGLDAATAFTLISVDPERDTPERLGEYVHYFNPKFEGATGDPAQLDSLTRQLGIAYAIQSHAPGERNYTVDHSSTVVLIDPDARLHAVFTPPHSPEQMAADFAKIRRHYEETR
jgi:protein SCO1/2